MIRITGKIGQWPVDLNIEMSEGDWAQLKGVPSEGAEVTSSATPVPRPAPSDALWQNALALVRTSGQISGPALFEQLEALAGDTVAGKRLLVRLRHCDQVRVVSGTDAPLYTWAQGQ
jgi:hypothetical protein